MKRKHFSLDIAWLGELWNQESKYQGRNKSQIIYGALARDERTSKQLRDKLRERVGE